MARRRSARLASAAKTPKPEPTLSSLTEGDESVYEDAAPSIDAIVSSPAPVPKTPGQSSPIKPPLSEMHPSKAHHSMAPPSSSLRLGFADIKPTLDLPAVAQSTPTKVRSAGLPATDFTFRYTREAGDLKLGPEAQRLMADLREEALKIKADLVAKREAEKDVEEETTGRKIAKPKGKAGRFSAAHMAEFKKMDSIANHPSVYRVQPGRVTPSTGLKRTQSKANLHDSESSRSKGKMSVSRPAAPKASDEPESPIKRARQRLEDDASSSRPLSRDGSFIPRPKSSGNDVVSGLSRSKSAASLMTPTKSSLARAAAAKTPLGSKIKSPGMLSGLKRSATTRTPGTGISRVVSPNITIRSPSGSRFAKVKSMFRGDKTASEKSKSSIPVMSAGSTTSLALDKPLPSLPTATPAKVAKRVVFTPQTKRVLETTLTTPSPLKSGLPKSNTRQPLGEVRYPILDTIMTGGDGDGDDDDVDAVDTVSYPDLSGHRPLPEPPMKEAAAAKKAAAAAPTMPQPPSSSGPGRFTFRSDHTISFGAVSPKGFGVSPGQSSVRQVRPSMAPTAAMPGSFPSSSTMATTTAVANPSTHTAIGSPNKENEAPAPAPTVFKALPHGMINKKRHRVSSDEEEAERDLADRAAKRRRADRVPEGNELLAPRLMRAEAGKAAGLVSPHPKRFATPGGAAAAVPGSPSPRKKTGLSLQRLNMLARPKNRK